MQGIPLGWSGLTARHDAPLAAGRVAAIHGLTQQPMRDRAQLVLRAGSCVWDSDQPAVLALRQLLARLGREARRGDTLDKQVPQRARHGLVKRSVAGDN